MTKARMITIIARTCGANKDRAATALDALLDELHASLLVGETVRLDRVGTLKLVPTHPRPGRNPKTGAQVTLAAGARGLYHPAKSLKRAAALVTARRVPRRAAE